MSSYTVIYEGRVQEQYVVEADSPEEAREKWPEYEPISREVIEGEVVEVSKDE